VAQAGLDRAGQAVGVDVAATASVKADASARGSFTSEAGAGRAVSPESLRLPASRNSLDAP
jgi:hypothetical protein